MKTFFRDEMIVVPSELTIPSHQKTFRMLTALQQQRKLELVADFQPIAPEQWIGIHDSSYVRSVAKADAETFYAASIPASQCMSDAIGHSAASMVAATSAALESGCSFSPTCGFHHAHWAQPGVFCLLNALPLAARLALTHTLVNNVLILDCDYHRGNGTEDILARLDDARIVHNSLGYKFSCSSQASAYLQEIDRTCQSIRNSDFDLVIYQAEWMFFLAIRLEVEYYLSTKYAHGIRLFFQPAIMATCQLSGILPVATPTRTATGVMSCSKDI
jgi:acetoin utilization deacetylase AcuC-like enzyme